VSKKKQSQRIFSIILVRTDEIFIKLVRLIPESTQDSTAVAFPTRRLIPESTRDSTAVAFPTRRLIPESTQDSTAVAFPTRNQNASPTRQCNTGRPLERF